MIPAEVPDKKITKKIRLFLSFDPPKFIEGTVTIPGPTTRLSDLINDDRAFLSIQDFSATGDWFHASTKFILLSKKEIKAIIELE